MNWNKGVSIQTGYAVLLNGKNYGPIELSGLKYLVSTNKILFDTPIFDHQNNQWKFLCDIDEFSNKCPDKRSFKSERPLVFLLKKQKLVGPYTTSQIVKKIRGNEVFPFDHALIEGQKEMIFLKEIKKFNDEFLNFSEEQSKLCDFKDILNDKEFDLLMRYMIRAKDQTILPPVPSIDSEEMLADGQHFEVANDPIWVLSKELMGESEKAKRYFDILKLIQNGTIDKSAKIKKIWEKDWTTIAELYEFNTNIVRKVANIGGQTIEKIFIKRRFPRGAYYCPVLVTTSSNQIRGTCTVIGVGGCFVEMETDQRIVGEKVSIRFMTGAIPLEFECNAEIAYSLSKRPQGVGLKFIEIDETVAEEIREFVDRYIEKIKETSKEA